MRGRSLRAIVTAAVLGGGLGVAAPTVASAEMYVNVLPLQVPTTAVEVGSQRCVEELGGGPYADRDVWVFELPGDRARTGDFGSLAGTFTTLDQRQVTREAPSADGGIVADRAWLAVERGARLTSGVAGITGLARELTIAQTCPASPVLEPATVRAAKPTPTPTVTPTPTPTPTPTATPTPRPTPTKTLDQLPQGTVDLVEPDANPAPVAPVDVIDTGASSDGPPAGYSDGTVPGTVQSDVLPNSGGMYADGTILDNGPTGYDGGFVPNDQGTMLGDDGGAYTDPGTAQSGNQNGNQSGNQGGSQSGSQSGGYDGGYIDPGYGDGGYSSGGDNGLGDSGGGDNGLGDSGGGDPSPSDSAATTAPFDWQTSPTTGLNYSGAGSSTTADLENTPKPLATPEPGTAGESAGSAGPAVVALQSEDDKLLAGAKVLRLTAILAAFAIAGLGMTLLRRRRRLTRVIGRHRAA